MLVGHRNGMLAGGSLPYKRRLEYIESTGTQWIDTGIASVDNVGFSLEFESYWSWQTGAIEFPSIIGSQLSDYDYYIALYFGYSHSILGNLFAEAVLSAHKWYTVDMESDGGRFAASINYLGDGLINVGGKTESANLSDIPERINFYLFANGQEGTLGAGDPSVARIYWAKMSIGATVVRDFIPVIDPNDEPKIFDLVTQTYPTHHGSFIAGPDL